MLRIKDDWVPGPKQDIYNIPEGSVHMVEKGEESI